jgi:hypothetical protein
MLRFHRTHYTTMTGRLMEATWWQLGDRIFRHRQRAL